MNMRQCRSLLKLMLGNHSIRMNSMNSTIIAGLLVYSGTVFISAAAPPRTAESVRVSVAQMNIIGSEISPGKDRVDMLVPWMDKAVSEKADLLVFPEYLLGQFHLTDPIIVKLCGEAKRRNLNVIAGGWECKPDIAITHPPEAGTYSNSVLVIDRQVNEAVLIEVERQCANQRADRMVGPAAERIDVLNIDL